MFIAFKWLESESHTEQIGYFVQYGTLEDMPLGIICYSAEH